MLRALKSQLMQLAKDPLDPFAQTIRARVGPKEAVRYTKGLRSMILVMPELITQIQAWLEDPAVPARFRKLHGFLLTYLYHPDDFLPEGSSTGLFSYLDDAYLVGSVYCRTMGQMDHATCRSLPNLEDLSEQISIWLEAARKLLPAETQRIERLLEVVLEGRTQEAVHRLTGKAH